MKRISACSEHTLSAVSKIRNRYFAGHCGTAPNSRSQRSGSFALVLARSTLLCLSILTLGLAGCDRQQSAAHAFPPTNVTVSKPVQKEVVNWSEFTGRTAAVNLVNVTARVSGYIVSIPFKEGDIVHKGDLLYQIDPRPYQDAYDQALGQLKQAQANRQLQDLTFERQQRLQQSNVIAKEITTPPFQIKTKPQLR